MKKSVYFKILADSYRRADTHLARPFIKDQRIKTKIEHVALCLRNRAGIRALLACLLAKIQNPKIDIRKPYTGIEPQKGSDNYSGRFLDENYVQQLLSKPYFLPINSTTAFLTPGFRTKNIILTPDVELEGRPADMYRAMLQLLDDVQANRISAKNVMDESIRLLILERNQRKQSLDNLLRDIKRTTDHLPLSAEDVIALVNQHLACRNSSRLPVLIIAAAYKAAAKQLQEQVLSFYAHTAADSQTGAMADLEITLVGDNQIITAYEMKMKPVTMEDINIALRKVAQKRTPIQNYIFITTAKIETDVCEYARQKYEETGGIEFAILDCIGFLRHFLHLFYRIRSVFLDEYQELVLKEPESAVSFTLKEAFLSLRKTAEGAR
jgi:hypothetical protein